MLPSSPSSVQYGMTVAPPPASADDSTPSLMWSSNLSMWSSARPFPAFSPTASTSSASSSQCAYSPTSGTLMLTQSGNGNASFSRSNSPCTGSSPASSLSSPPASVSSYSTDCEVLSPTICPSLLQQPSVGLQDTPLFSPIMTTASTKTAAVRTFEQHPAFPNQDLRKSMPTPTSLAQAETEREGGIFHRKRNADLLGKGHLRGNLHRGVGAGGEGEEPRRKQRTERGRRLSIPLEDEVMRLQEVMMLKAWCLGSGGKYRQAQQGVPSPTLTGPLTPSLLPTVPGNSNGDFLKVPSPVIRSPLSVNSTNEKVSLQESASQAYPSPPDSGLFLSLAPPSSILPALTLDNPQTTASLNTDLEMVPPPPPSEIRRKVKSKARKVPTCTPENSKRVSTDSENRPDTNSDGTRGPLSSTSDSSSSSSSSSSPISTPTPPLSARTPSPALGSGLAFSSTTLFDSVSDDVTMTDPITCEEEKKEKNNRLELPIKSFEILLNDLKRAEERAEAKRSHRSSLLTKPTLSGQDSPDR